MTVPEEVIDKLIENANTYDPQYDPKLGESTIKFPHEPLGGATLLGKIFDVLSRGEYASAGVAKDFMLGKPFDAKTITKGLGGVEKTTYDALTPELFPEWSPWKQKAMGLAMAVAFDPTTYIPFGAFTKPLLKSSKEVAKKAGGKLAKAAIPSAGVPKDYYLTRYFAQKGLEAEQQRVIKDIKEISKHVTQKEADELTYLRQHPKEAVNISPKLKQKLDAIGVHFDGLTDQAFKEGLIDEAAYLKWSADKTYVPGYYPQSSHGIGIIKGEIPPSLMERGKKSSFLKQKTIKTIEDAKQISGEFLDVSKSKTRGELERKIAKYGMEDAFGNFQYLDVGDMKSFAKNMSKQYKPVTNIFEAMAYRTWEHNATVARKKFVNDVVETYGTKVKAGTKVVPKGMGLYLPKGNLRFMIQEGVPAETVAKLFADHGEFIPIDALADTIRKYPAISKRVPTYMMPKDIANDLNKGMRLMSGDPSTNAFWKLVDKPVNAWKTMATAMRLPFHLRNMYSNWWQAYLSGVRLTKLPKRLTQAGIVQVGKQSTIKLGKKIYNVADLNKLVDDLGVRGKGWLAADITSGHVQELNKVLRHSKFRKGAARVNPANLGKEFGITIENNSRIAVFLDQLAKGADPQKAARQVRKYLFDYSELTELERRVFKRILPFYTWSRKNIPLQIESVLTQPQKYQFYVKGLRAFSENETKEEQALKPKYFDELLYVKSSFKTDKGKPLYMSIDLPPMEFNRMFSFKNWLSAVSPWKVVAEIAYNVKSFPEMSKIQGQKLEKARAPGWVPLLPSWLFDKMKENHIISPIIDRQTGTKILGMDKKWIHGIQTAFPFLSEVNRIYADPVYLEDERPENKKKSYLTGIGHKGLDVKREREKKYYDERSLLRKEIKFAKQHGRMLTEEEREILRGSEK